MVTLEELITDSRRQRDERNAQREAEKLEREQREEQQLNAAIENAISRIDDSLPEALRPFVVYAGPPPKPEQLQRYPEGWTPCDFKIANAPGLIEIQFTTTATTPTGFIHVAEIRIVGALGTVRYGTDWSEAIADASESQPTTRI